MKTSIQHQNSAARTRISYHPATQILPSLLAYIALLATLTPPAEAAVTEAWVYRYNNVVSNAPDQAVNVVRDAAGDIIVAGNTDDGTTGSDMLTIKYSGANGTELWQRRYNGPANYDDVALAVAVDSSGNVVVTGYSYSGISADDYHADYYTAKYAAADGALLWEKRYDGPRNYDDSAQAVAVDGSGNVVVTGYSYNGTNSDYYYTAKYAAADGVLLWEQRSNGGGQAVAVDDSGNVVVTGSSYSSSSSYPDYYTAKYAGADGTLLWERRYNNGPRTDEDRAQAVAVDDSGNVVVTGYSEGRFGDYYTAKYAAADGALLWEQRYDGPTYQHDYAQAVAVDGSGNVVVTGHSGHYSFDPFNGGSRFVADYYYTAKYAAADGTLLWEKRGPGGLARSMAVDGSGNVVVTGDYGGDYYTAKYAVADGALLWEKRGPGGLARSMAVDGSGNVVVTGDYGGDYYTAKYAAADGALLWEQRYDGPQNGSDYANAVAVDGSGDVVVTGSSGDWPNSDYYTAKYAATDGALLWEKRYDGPTNSNDQARAVAVDASGNVIVTGSSGNESPLWPPEGGRTSYYGYYTAKYAAADGTLLWEKRYNGPANADDQATAVAVDGSGNVIVTGYSYGTNNSYDYDYYTAKYAAADGALLWEQRYYGPANSGDFARALAVDSNGNVVVTGTSYTGGLGDYYTAKYAAADGALLWENRYNGPTNSDDRAQALAVDSSGNVVVTGSSYNGSNDDYYTAKYAAPDGALLWEKRYNGPANNGDGAQALAVDGSGNVVVTGWSYNTNGNSDYYTAKYAAADGALLWGKRYNGPANSSDYASAVAVDASGNVVVTGSSGDWPNSDYYTAKYAAADGALLWEKRYNGPVNGEDYAASLALGPNGMVAVTGSSDGDYATVLYRENLPPFSIELIPAGILLRFTGVPGRSYTIERAPTVTGLWNPIATPIAPVSGLIEYVDTNAPPGQAFYRVRQP